jgi:hypothetical protein
MAELIIGLDLGQAADFTALAILERSAVLTNALRQVRSYGCRALKRWPLGTPYTTIVAAVVELFHKPTLTGAALVVDATGVGRPVVDMFRKAGLCGRLVPVIITAGHRQCVRDGFFHVPKIALVSALHVLLQQRRLRFARALVEAPALLRELQGHRIEITDSLNERFGACPGEHDDLLVAVALAAWHGEHGLGQAQTRA